MTASAGLHNMPADMRGAVVAEAGSRVRSRRPRPDRAARARGGVGRRRAGAGDAAKTTCTRRSREQLGVDRATAKVAVLGAMYGQTTGHGARALRRLEAAYPVAMAYLRRGRPRRAAAPASLRTYGGRLIPMGSPAPTTS